ncbi:Unknown protein, partial [Striga hermonthica]
SEVTGKLDRLADTIASLQLQLLNRQKDSDDEGSILGKHRLQLQQEQASKQNNHYMNPAPKIEFPRFDGSNPRAWILKCSGYFKLVPNISKTQKVILASMHLEGKAALWFQNLSAKQPELNWSQFVEIVSARFEELKEVKIIAKFNKLRHTGSYADYVDKFEELKACMQLMNQGEFSEEYFIASFISGLSEELQAFLHMFNPKTLQQTIELGQQQLHTLDAITKRVKNTQRTYSQLQHPNTQKATPNNNPIQRAPQTPFQKANFKLLTSSEMAARREKGLCYNCDEKFVPGHRCKHRINYMIMTEDEELSYFQYENVSNLENTENNEAIEEVHISLNTMVGEGGLTTLRFYGYIGDKRLHILLDTGSTLSFIKESTAKSLGCSLNPVKPLKVKVANGQKLISHLQATDLSWDMQGQEVTHSLRVLQIEGSDIILGGDWLRTCTPIELDYNTMTVTINLKGKKVILQALNPEASCHLISEHSLL